MKSSGSPGTNFRFGLDPLIGLIPGIGESNVRNYEIIKNHRLGTAARGGDWVFVLGVLAILFVVVCVGIAISFLVLGALVRLL